MLLLTYESIATYEADSKAWLEAIRNIHKTRAAMTFQRTNIECFGTEIARSNREIEFD